jgi:CIC family chloride channel protein
MPSEVIPVAPSLETEFDLATELEETQPVNRRVFFLSLQAIVNAIIIGIIAKALVGLISLVTNISFYGRFSFEEASPAGNALGWFVILVPVIGGIIVGIMARFGSGAIRGHGIPEAMEQVLLNESKINPLITFLKPLSAAIAIGTGGPFGAEGPIIATGGAFGSGSGQIMRISPNERKIMLAAGACAGMSAIFGTPLAAVMLAIELLLFEFSPRSIIPVALACITGAALHFALFGTDPVFPMPAIPEPSTIAMVTYVILGLIIGVLAALVSKSVYLVEDLFEKLPIHWMWWPAIGGVAVGVVGYFAPRTLGVGYSNITAVLTGTMPLTILVSLSLLKFLSWTISLGSGTSGGTLAPLLTIGGAIGGLLGLVVHTIFPLDPINLSVCALIGMAAMFAGASRALLTSIVFALEATMQPHGLLPLMGACTASYFISFFLMKGSIMTEKIERRGVFTPNSYEPDLLQSLRVQQTYIEELNVLDWKNTIKEAREWIKQAADVERLFTWFAVVDDSGGLVGMVSRKDIFDKLHSDVTPISEWVPKSSPYVYPESRLSLAVALMDKYMMDSLPVVSHDEKKELLGIITHREIFEAYHKQRTGGNLTSRVISLKQQGIRVVLKGRQLLNRK